MGLHVPSRQSRSPQVYPLTIVSTLKPLTAIWTILESPGALVSPITPSKKFRMGLHVPSRQSRSPQVCPLAIVLSPGFIKFHVTSSPTLFTKFVGVPNLSEILLFVQFPFFVVIKSPGTFTLVTWHPNCHFGVHPPPFILSVDTDSGSGNALLHCVVRCSALCCT